MPNCLPSYDRQGEPVFLTFWDSRDYMLRVDQNRFSIGKDIYYPFSVELHYFRVEKRYWSVCFEKIKKAGFRIISTAVPWNLHQSKNKDIDFNGFQESRKDLVVFLELAREFGFKIILRPGPWIAGQWPNGGIPDFVLQDEELLARDSKGETIPLTDPSGVPAGKLVSYLHPHFQHFLKNYMKNLIETTRNYIHPRGPVFMVEFDFETSFCRKTDAGDADYNEYVLNTLYPNFLEEKFENIKQLNALYKEKNKSFADIEPMREFDKLTIKDLPKLLDWYHFKEKYLSDFLDGLEDLFKSYTVLPFFFRSLYFKSERPLPEFSLSVAGPDESDSQGEGESEGTSDIEHLVSTSVFPDGSSFDLMQKARYMRTAHNFAWSSAFISGNMTLNVEESEVMMPITDGRRRFFAAAGLAGGFKGINHYMFVNRDHWYGAPIDSDGAIGSGFEIIKRLNIAIPKMELNNLSSGNSLVAAFYRPYQWLSSLSDAPQFEHVKKLLFDTFNGVSRDFSRLGFDFGVADISDPERLLKFKTAFIPVGEVMDAKVQEGIAMLAEKGVNLILSGLMPKYDESGVECSILAKKLHIRTTAAAGIGEVECARKQKFMSHQYGVIKTTDAKAKKIAMIKNKPVGVLSTRLKGKVFFFSFDLASGGDFRKVQHLETVLSDCKLTTPIYISDPNVEVILQSSEKAYALFVLAPPAGDLGDASEFRKKSVLLKVDLRQAGYKGTRIVLRDQFAAEEDEPIKTTVDGLKNGITFEIDFPDAKIFLVEKK